MTLNVITNILSERSNENLYGIVLHTDSSTMTVCLSANSTEELQAILDSDSDKSKENPNYYKCAISEWSYESYEAELFSELSKELRLFPDRAQFSEFKRDLIDSLTNVLKRVKEEVFKRDGDIVTMFVSITDDDAECIENVSSKLINIDVIHDLFLQRYEWFK
ncbi:DUF4303 domain-containing protein [Vibrio ostreae]|uniref:DUF4303 domain-containing protein n=1 Tax=Vibrio ostreae TaxID=2841925 RepID=A0A975YMK0_9VIBR|nr:DUF4303 domain-containing protein [Vibrio ostreae]QXO16515.1 DUF4303 domain-containing protein [Vibrio ostreae]